MNITESKISLFKLHILDRKYKIITNVITNIVNHIHFLDLNYLIEYNKKSSLLASIFDINKNINSTYNSYILLNTDKQNINNNLINLIDNTNCSNFNLLYSITELFINKVPYYNEINILSDIVKSIGYSNLTELFEFLNIPIFSDNIKKILEEIKTIFKPISLNIFNLNQIENVEYFWRTPVNYTDMDILQLTRELWIQKNNNTYYKIEGIFDSDILSIKLKTSQIISPYLYKKKRSILDNTDLKLIFVKKFIRHNYIGNIYCMSTLEYTVYLLSSYKMYEQLIKLSFINIMKNFINNSMKLHNLYYIIFLLLLGDDNNIGIASLLINLTKEKKINSLFLYNLLNKNLSFSMQFKIKKESDNIKNELDKLKLISIESIDYKKRLLSIKNLPDTVKLLTLEKINEMKSQNNEFYKQKNFVETILKFPWYSNKKYIDTINSSGKVIDYLNNIKINLNKLTYGHIEAKNTLLQIIAKWITDPCSGGKPIGLVGPPGVGKTLLAKSISSALNIPFAEITLGGQNDGELLHGHGYTYSGSQPGLIIKKMIEMGEERCILFFDELDKTASKHGSINEITSILIHLTDPNMNKSFQDRFFQGIDFPLDKVIMIFSYNDSEKIDHILLDRITEIKIKAYTIQDKILIVKNFVIPELKLNIDIDFNINFIEYIIINYTNEAGIRDIKRNIEKIYMTLNFEILTNVININSYKLSTDEIDRILLKPKIENLRIHNISRVGIINGLYATLNGNGGITSIQIFNNFSSNNFEIKLTGSQGQVMKESVDCSLTCAINYIKNKASLYGISNFIEYFQDNFKFGFHVHTPSASTPKDGPSAGCAFTCAFISRILNKTIYNNIAITGEIELTGKITKIGGLDFKLLGAKKAGVKIVYIPLENKDDLDEFIFKNPLFINEDFSVILIDYLDDVINKIIN